MIGRIREKHKKPALPWLAQLSREMSVVDPGLRVSGFKPHKPQRPYKAFTAFARCSSDLPFFSDLTDPIGGQGRELFCLSGWGLVLGLQVETVKQERLLQMEDFHTPTVLKSKTGFGMPLHHDSSDACGVQSQDPEPEANKA